MLWKRMGKYHYESDQHYRISITGGPGNETFTAWAPPLRRREPWRIVDTADNLEAAKQLCDRHMEGNTEGAASMAEAAKAIGISRNQLFKQLREAGQFDAHNIPSQELRHKGYFRLETRAYFHTGLGRQVQYEVVIVTPAGLHWLQNRLSAKPQKRRGPQGQEDL